MPSVLIQGLDIKYQIVTEATGWRGQWRGAVSDWALRAGKCDDVG